MKTKNSPIFRFALNGFQGKRRVLGNTIALALTFFGSLNLFGQQSGVYLTAQDYQDHKLSHASPCGNAQPIKLNEFLDKSYITIKHNDKEVKLKKDSIYAIHDCDGSIHRFYKHHDSDYVIKENKSITIYGKEISVSTSKGFTPDIQYFFSTTLAGEVQLLTIENVKTAFATNEQLLDAIDQAFPNGEGITQYDKFNKMFKVNHFLARFIK